MEGEHTLDRCREVTEEVLRTVFDQLYKQRVMLEGMILKPNMVLPGLTCPKQETVDEVADATVQCLLQSRPRRRSRDCVPVGRPIRRTGLRPFECHECQIQVAPALGFGVFVCPRHPAAGFGDLARRRGQSVAGTARPCIIGPVAIGLRAAANMMPRWKANWRESMSETKHRNTRKDPPVCIRVILPPGCVSIMIGDSGSPSC